MKFCPLYSGSSGNSIFISSKNAKILIDAGLPGKRIENALKEINEAVDGVDAIFVTHEHTDHTKGVGVLSRRYDIPIYANVLTWKAMLKNIGKIKENNIKIIDSKSTIDIKDLQINGYRISHDAVDPMGYAVRCGGRKVCVATDLGYFSKEVRKAVEGSDVVLLECNHDVEMLKFGPYPYPLKKRILSEVGHLSNEDCGKAIVTMIDDNCKRVVLGHLSKTNNYPELAYQTVLSVLHENKVEINKDVFIDMAKRDMPSICIEL